MNPSTAQRHSQEYKENFRLAWFSVLLRQEITDILFFKYVLRFADPDEAIIYGEVDNGQNEWDTNS